MRTSSFTAIVRDAFLASSLIIAHSAIAANAPAWMHAQVNAALPAHDDQADAVVLFNETILNVQPNGSIKRLYRVAYKILRPDGTRRGIVRVDFDAQTRIAALHAWCIPMSGKDYELKEKDAVESALQDVEEGQLASDERTKLLRIPAATVGNIVGYEVEQEQRPYLLADDWEIQDTIPVSETHYTLQLPTGWSYKATWLNHAVEAPSSTAPGQSQWVIKNVPPIRIETQMPPWHGIAARMFISLTPPDGKEPIAQSWQDIGAWYLNLTRGRRDATPAIKQKAAELTASLSSPLAKIRALANFVQTNIRYVAIELGIGGYQPHAAADIFANRFGDCKDKATLLNVMLHEIGIESYYVIINTERGSVVAATPPNLNFNHAILAIGIPNGVEDSSLLASTQHPKLGKILFFDPTDELTPLGRLSGALQSNFGVLVTPDGGELTELPKLPATSNAVNRTAQLTLDKEGTLRGEIHETRSGDPASMQRNFVRSTTQSDQTKPIEAFVTRSFNALQISHTTIEHLNDAEQPFTWHSDIEAANYAKVAGDLLLVRARVFGSKTSGMLETKEPREHSIEFERPERDTDVFEITLPDGYDIDELPPPVTAEEDFASYRSVTQKIGRKLRYTRTFEIKQLSVPVSKADKLKQLYRIIQNDERNSAVLKKIA